MIIHIMLSNDKLCEIQPKIIEFIAKNIVDKKYINFGDNANNLTFKFIFNPQHIIESKLPQFKAEDIIIWHPVTAGNNLDIMKQYTNSIVILPRKTILIQKISKNNPITENMAINHEFKILYIDPSAEEITNEEWKLVIPENHYSITIEKLINLIQTQLQTCQQQKMLVKEILK